MTDAGVRRRLNLLGATLLLAACQTSTPTPDPCVRFPQNIDANVAFCDDSAGGGIFGRWTTDGLGRPSFRYDPKARNRPEAVVYTTEENNSRRHWHMAGNGQTVSMFDNRGAITLYSLERGTKTIGTADDGFAGLWTPGIRTTNGVQRFRPDELTQIEFLTDGVRYRWQKGEISLNAIVTVRRPQVGFEQAPANSQLFIRASLQNSGDGVLSADFGLSIEQQVFTGVVGGSAAASIRAQRRAYYRGRPLSLVANEHLFTLSISTPDNRHLYGPWSEDVTAPEVYVWSQTPGAWRWNREAMPVSTTTWNPAAVTAQWQAAGMPQNTLYRFAVAYDYPHLTWPDGLTRSGEAQLPEVAADILFAGHPEMRRELWWHSQSLNANLQYDQYFRRHMVNQGSAYGYYEGVNGAPRDFVLAANPLNHLQPDVVRQTLETILMMTRTDGQIMYALIGVGKLEGLVVHEAPSDPDIFLLWGAAEYLGRTRNFDWLTHPVPFYGQTTTGPSVLNRLQASFYHLRDTIGTGAHGLIRLQDGDWSDGILLRADNPAVARLEGESVLNSAMVAALFPRLADVLQNTDAQLASDIRRFAAEQFAAMQSAWNGQWYLRGYESPHKALGDKQIFLAPQVFAMLALQRFGETERAQALAHTVYRKLSQPSKLGPWLVWPADEFNPALPVGWDVNGGSWHAMNGIWVWALSKIDPALAMQQWRKASMRQHAIAYPKIWYGIWSGPDSFNADYAERPGETFFHLATPMTDFPVQNSNQHAMPLWSAIAGLAGVEFGANGLLIDSTIAGCPQRIKLADLQLYCTQDSGELRITPSASGSRTDRIKLPARPEAVRGFGASASVDHNSIIIEWEAVAGQQVRVLWGAQ